MHENLDESLTLAHSRRAYRVTSVAPMPRRSPVRRGILMSSHKRHVQMSDALEPP